MRIPCGFDDECPEDHTDREIGSKPTGSSSSMPNQWPSFNREPASFENSLVLVSGPTQYMKSVEQNKEYMNAFLELHVPKRFRPSFAAPVFFAVYEDASRKELKEVIILSDGIHKALSERTRPLQLVIGIDSFLFRTSQECRLWFALIGDVKTASPTRFKELIDSKDSPAPRGYRTQFAELQRSTSSTNVDHLERLHDVIPLHPSSILSAALSCMDYLSGRLEHCRCSNNVSLDMEDFVYETRAKITKLIEQAS